MDKLISVKWLWLINWFYHFWPTKEQDNKDNIVYNNYFTENHLRMFIQNFVLCSTMYLFKIFKMADPLTVTYFLANKAEF